MNRRLDQIQFLKECESIRGDKFDYTGVIFHNWKTKIEIVCKVCRHNWLVTPINFLVNKTGCPVCRNKRHKERCNKDRLSLDQFIQKSKLIHGDVYDYSESKYVNSKSKVDIICKLHGKFQQVAYDHYNGIGCNKCRYITS